MNLPSDVQRLIYQRLDDSTDSMRLSMASTSWRQTFESSPEIHKTCVYDADYGTSMRSMWTYTKHIEKIPRGTVEDFEMYVDIFSCPDFEYGVLRSMLTRLCDALENQGASLRFLTLSFVHDAIRPCRLRRVIRMLQPSFFRLQQIIGRLERLEWLSLAGCLVPVHANAASIRGEWMMAETGAVTFRSAPSVLLTRFRHEKNVTNFHVLIKPTRYGGFLAEHVAAGRHFGGSFEVCGADLVHVRAWGRFTVSPFFPVAETARRAMDHALYGWPPVVID